MRFLSIQSSVSFGHVGNSAAVFPLQRLGVEVMPVHTVCFSNHTGYGAWRGPMLKGDDIREIVTGIEERGALTDVDAVLSGYQGGNDIGDAILEAVEKVKQHSPDAVYACDPVLGNARSGCHVAPEVQDLIRDRVVPRADLITPNQFELGFVTGTTPLDLDSTLAAVDTAFGIGPSTVLVTSVELPDLGEEKLSMIAADRDEAWLITTPRLPMKRNGSGDVTAALFTAHWLRTGSLAEALERTTSSVFTMLERTLRADTRELQLIASQDAFAEPAMEFRATRIR
ncbi:pyridoxal kinase PdxY [Arachnia propionica]|uniref:pyridoxal kinase n=1 Tax=Arachnia propionica TaxID=1750 RepID=A0A3P1T627_9ACTN|nr:pyridoxal kinase PdxY [Arachnia propionica]MDO5083491.1 pyridoxal kinase PdxY [Arachnia propionica]RRD04957.1 pyridoxal kinase PdxY [Arachnia propionica]